VPSRSWNNLDGEKVWDIEYALDRRTATIEEEKDIVDYGALRFTGQWATSDFYLD